MSNRPHSDERGRTVIVDVEGEGAYERAARTLERRTEGIDRARVRRVYAEIDIEAVEPDDVDEEPPDDDQGSINRSRLTEEDRSFGDIQPGTSHHEALHLLDEMGATEDSPVDSRDVADVVQYQKPSTVTVSLGKLYRRKLVERRKQDRGGGYLYWVSKHGETVLGELGPFGAGDEDR